MTITEKQLRDAKADFNKVTCEVTALEWFKKHAGNVSIKKNPVLHALQFALDMRWRPIGECPDGQKALTIKKVLLSDDFYEPEVLYRNGDYWFREAGNRATRPDFFIPLDALPTPPETQGEE